jgi:hypothetical protein
MTKTVQAPVQQLFLFRRGGARPGAGRKPEGPRSKVSHEARSPLSDRHPILVTLRIRSDRPNLRCLETLPVIHGAFREGADRFGFRLVEFVILANHIHLVSEAECAESLSRAMQGLKVRIARRLNSAWGLSGSLFADRFHERALSSPIEVRNGLVYTLQNARKHGIPVHGIDPFSSGRWFDGWKNRVGRPLSAEEEQALPNVLAQTWLGRVGWRQHGLIGVDEAPASARSTR